MNENQQERRILDESDRLIRDLFNNAPCGYHSLDPNGVVMEMNDTELSWLGYEYDEVVGRKRYSELMSPGTRAVFEENFPKLKAQGELRELEFDLQRRDGNVFPVLLNSRAVRDDAGNFLRTRSTVFDISLRKQSEQALQRFNEALELRVAERTAALAAANVELAHKNEENEMFVYSVSHDLRAPLVNLQGFSHELELAADELRGIAADTRMPDPLRDKTRRVLDADFAEAIRFIRNSVMRLSHIIDALLRLSRAGRVEYTLQRVDLQQVVRNIVDSERSTIAARGVLVVIDELPEAWGDPTALEQLFANLLDNAVKYLDPTRPGEVRIGVANAGDKGETAGSSRAGGQPVYFVQDNGVGIPPELQPKLFRAFQRLHPAMAPGEGMGLRLVQRIVERHQGQIWVESVVGKGSLFSVWLPRALGNAPLAAGVSSELLPR